MRELELARQLSNEELVLHLDRSVQADRRTTVRLLAHMGEVDARGLHRDQGFSSMFDYAVQRLHMSEAEAALRIRVARLGREFPVTLEMLGRGELHLTALNLLAPVLSHANLSLLQQARFQSKQKVLELRAQYAPQPDAPASVRRLPERRHAGATAVASTPSSSAESALKTTPASAAFQGSPQPFASSTPPSRSRDAVTAKLAPLAAFVSPSAPCPPRTAVSSTGPDFFDPLTPCSARTAVSPTEPDSVSPLTSTAAVSPSVEAGRLASIANKPAAGHIPAPSVANAVTVPLDSRSAPLTVTCVTPAGFELSTPSPASAVVPLSPARFKVTFTASQRVRDKLEEAQDLLRHQLPCRDLEQLFERALDALIAEHKKRRFALTNKPRKARPARSEAHSRYIASDVRRRVWARDGGRCCFRGPDGARCGARSRLEFHHILPFERGGPTTVDNLALVCKAHNALLAERDYGREYIRSRISAARHVRAGSATQRTQAHEGDVSAGHHPVCAARQARPAQPDACDGPPSHRSTRIAREPERAHPNECDARASHRQSKQSSSLRGEIPAQDDDPRPTPLQGEEARMLRKPGERFGG